MFDPSIQFTTKAIVDVIQRLVAMSSTLPQDAAVCGTLVT